MRILLVLVYFCSLTGCSTVGYLLQAGLGQLKLSNRAVPISEVLQNDKVNDRTKNHLREVERVKLWGEKQGLKPTKNYTDYVQMDDTAVVWVVSASDELSFKAHTWSFPLVGSFTYLGWFSKEKAITHAKDLKDQGYDTDVRGAQAFSTLGWFRDSVLSTMISTGENSIGDLVNTILHESVHATIYINGQSTFNESLANFIADTLTPKYLLEVHTENSILLSTYLKSKNENEKRVLSFREAYKELNLLYQSQVSDDEKRKKKAKVLSLLETKVQAKRAINNATLIQFQTYESNQDQFESSFKACHEQLSVFFKALSASVDSEREQAEDQDIKRLLSKTKDYCEHL